MQPRCSVISQLEPMFRPIGITPYIVTHILLLVTLFLATLLLPFPFFCKYHGCHLQTYTLQALLHVFVWAVSAVIHCVLHRIHFESYIHGYSEFHNQSTVYRKFAVVVYSIGNTLLLVLSLVLRELPPSDQPLPPPPPPPAPLPSQWPLSAFHCVQLLVALEVVVLLPMLIQYLRLALRFNTARAPPDVADEDAELRPRRLPLSRRADKDETAYLRHLMRRQADCIQALRAHNTMLGRKIVEQQVRLTAAAGQT